jgi:F5/8 type C domain
VPGNATDGNTSTYWESVNSAFPQWLQVDLGAAKSFSRIVLDLPPSSSWSTRTQTLTASGSTDGSGFSTIVAPAGYTFNPSTGNTVTITLPATSARRGGGYRTAVSAPGPFTASLIRVRAEI